MGLYSKALLINTKSGSRGLQQKTPELIEKQDPGILPETVQEEQAGGQEIIRQPIVLPAAVSDEINQQLTVCKINKLPLAIVFFSCTRLVAEVLRNNRNADPAVLRSNIFTFLEQFFSDESRLFNLGSDRFLFTLYNPNTVNPELVLFQLSEILRYNVPDISEDVEIDFDRTIRYYPDNGENIEILLNDVV